ncbi:MAG: choice-of-anchor D domain-containing protein [Candidatus Kapaibacterium sp.]
MGAPQTSVRNRHGRKYATPFLALFLLFSFSNVAVGQPHWAIVNTPSFGISKHINPYFLNENIGFIFVTTAAEPFYRTTNGGVSWKAISIPPFVINQIYFLSISHGYIAASDGVLETNDTGITWKNIYPGTYTYSVYAAGKSVFATTGTYNVVETQNDGKKWELLIPRGSYLIGNKDSLVLVTRTNPFVLWYSTNNGKDWDSNSVSPETQSVYCFPHCNELLRTNLVADVDPVTYSLDYGKKWMSTSLLTPELAVWFAGSSCATYISNALTTGLYRSVDRGFTWVSVPGPNFKELDDNDFRNLAVVGNGSVIYVCDINGVLWKSTDGGDGTLSLNTFSTQFGISCNVPSEDSTLGVAVCDTDKFMFFLQNFTCNSLHLESLSIDGLDSNEYEFQSRIHYLCNSLPDTVILSIFPQFPGNHPIMIHEHFTNNEYHAFDTSFSFTLNAAYSIAPKLSFHSLRFDSTSGMLDFGSKLICFGGGVDTISLSNPSCAGLQIRNIRLETDSNSTKDFTLNEVSPYELNIRTSPNTIILHYDPQTPGFKSGKIVIETSIGNDTVLVSANAIVDTAKLIIEKNDTVFFDPKPLCLAGGRDTIALSNPSCYNVKVKGINFVTDSLTNYDFTVWTTGPAILRIDAQARKIFIYFHPVTSGLKTGKVIIETDLRNDTIVVIGDVTEDLRTVSSNCDNMQSPICDSVDGFLHLANLSCRTMTLESIACPAPFHLLPMKLPVTLVSGAYLAVPIRFIPSQHGSSVVKANAVISIYQPLGTVTFDTTFILSAIGLHGASSYSLSTMNALFDSVHLCDSAKRHLVLRSTGCDSLPLRAISISGDPDFTYSVLGSRNSPLAVGDSIAIDVFLHPISQGNKSATITLTLADSSTITIPISAIVTRSLRILSSDAGNVIDFGKRFTCDNNDTTITLVNSGCDTLQIFGVNISGTGFALSFPYPFRLLPGESRKFDVQTRLDTTGGTVSNSAQLTFTSDADRTIAPITLTGGYIYPHPVHLILDANAAPLSSQSVWKVKLKAPANEITDLHSIDLALNYNSDLLDFIPGNSSMQSADGKTFHLAGSPAISAAADSTIADITFEVMLSKDSVTYLSLGNIIFNGDPKFTECVAVPQTSGIDFTYLAICGDRSIRAFMQGKPLQLSIRPNPVQDEIVLDVNSPGLQEATIEIFDALGEKKYSGILSMISGSNRVHLATANYGQGVYVVRVNAANGLVSQSFVKVK